MPIPSIHVTPKFIDHSYALNFSYNKKTEEFSCDSTTLSLLQSWEAVPACPSRLEGNQTVFSRVKSYDGLIIVSRNNGQNPVALDPNAPALPEEVVTAWCTDTAAFNASQVEIKVTNAKPIADGVEVFTDCVVGTTAVGSLVGGLLGGIFGSFFGPGGVPLGAKLGAGWGAGLGGGSGVGIAATAGVMQVGYSYQDKTINQYISNCLNAYISLRIALEDVKTPFEQQKRAWSHCNLLVRQADASGYRASCPALDQLIKECRTYLGQHPPRE